MTHSEQQKSKNRCRKREQAMPHCHSLPKSELNTAGIRCLRMLWRTRSLPALSNQVFQKKGGARTDGEGYQHHLFIHWLMQWWSSARALIGLDAPHELRPRSQDAPHASRPRRGRAPHTPAAHSIPPELQCQTGASPTHSFTTTTSSAATAVVFAPWLLVADVGAAEVAESCSKARLVSAYVDPNPTPAPKPIVVALDAPPPVNRCTDMTKATIEYQKKTHGTRYTLSARARAGGEAGEKAIVGTNKRADETARAEQLCTRRTRIPGAVRAAASNEATFSDE